ncbi:phenylacetate--CoA ligase family protein [Microbacterium halotolerans]|uniref:phenylacetate--CoA ligase family protein n=1 Tax=Microbacterium halotolerans TaxID=246613 RepID=UPI000E6AAE7E|nr:phenylacetate--CoA ligase family protein [Microbacterium halotolerans]
MTVPIPGGSGRPNLLRQMLLRVVAALLTSVYSLYRVHPALWRLAARNYRPFLGRFAKLHAWMMCQYGFLDVPAYRDFQLKNGFRFRWWDLARYAPTDKKRYVAAYQEHERCWAGRIEVAGTVVDESSGSSGTPFNWMRSKRELSTVHRNVAGYVTSLFGTKRLFCINAFSMGAWATGTNTGIAMARVAMVKNTGPDLDKIVDTIRHFGPRYTYMVAAYPPFLKHLRDRLDAEGWDWDRWNINGFVGGEALTEGLRDYLQERFGRVYSGYGASDLTIGMGGESDLSVWLRRTIGEHDGLRREVLGEGEARSPMIFQYNPLDTYLETVDGSLVTTLNSTAIMAPKLRYDIGDEAALMSFPQMRGIVAGYPKLLAQFDRAHATQRLSLPFLLLYGRKDSTISYMGANIYPLDVENGLYADNPHAASIESFKLALIEVADHETRPIVHLQLREGAELAEAERAELAERSAEGVLTHLASASRDIAQSFEEDASARDIRVEVHDFGTGPFAGGEKKIKNVYLTDH